MAPFGLSRLRSLLRREGRQGHTTPTASWSRPFGQGWESPYTVRYASNLDDGPWHGAPLGGFGAGCIGRSSKGDFNLWNIDGGEHWFGSLPDCQFALFEDNGTDTRAHALAVAPEADSSKPEGEAPLSSWSWYPASTAEKPTGSYSARYPLSWFHYSGVFGCEASCESFRGLRLGLRKRQRNTATGRAVSR